MTTEVEKQLRHRILNLVELSGTNGRISTGEVVDSIFEAFREASFTALDGVDWKSKFEQQVSDNVRAAAQHKEKLAKAQLELDQANQELAKLRSQVKAEESNTRRIKQLNDRIEEMTVSHGQYQNRKAAEIKELRRLVNGGQRALMEAMINDLRRAADRLPILTHEEQNAG